MNTCRECAEGKHPSCDGTAWDFDADEPTDCVCDARDHHEGS